MIFVVKYPAKYRHTSKGDRYKMKTFKKGLSIILSVLMAFSCFALCASAAEDDISSLKVAVASDIHTVENEEINDLYGDGMFGNKGMLVSLHDESYGVIDSFMREAIANGAEHILITGDLTNRGTVEQHKSLPPISMPLKRKPVFRFILFPEITIIMTLPKRALSSSARTIIILASRKHTLMTKKPALMPLTLMMNTLSLRLTQTFPERPATA